ncbi:MAG: class II aldolase/adducin family protein [Pseudorhodobacter sp.]
MTRLTSPPGFDELRRYSAIIGADPTLIQGAGGNTSIKDGDGAVMWIKASGMLLADALDRDIFVPCDLPAMQEAVTKGTARADRPAEFSLLEGGLRPSIETSLHAVFPHRIVIHVHCVNTLALAIRKDAKEVIATRLSGFNWAFVPYAKPGADLAASVLAAREPDTDVVVLGNHGLIVAAETVPKAEKLVADVVAALAARPETAPHDPVALASRAGDGFVPLPPENPLHCVACLPRLLKAALAGSLYPDHVIFCGVGVTVLQDGESPAMALERQQKAGLPPPPFLLVPGAGALMQKDATDGASALAQCLGDVLIRLESGATVNPLTLEQNAELLNWDAEKYRQSLNAG